MNRFDLVFLGCLVVFMLVMMVLTGSCDDAAIRGRM